MFAGKTETMTDTPTLGPDGPPAPRAALIVAHGQPSAPEGPEKTLAAFAGTVADHLPGWHVQSATLAAPGALAAAIGALGVTNPVVYPLFMADGWFVGTNLPRKLAQAGAAEARVTPPLGLDPGLPALLAAAAAEGARANGWAPEDTAVLLAAHGSPSHRRPRQAAEAAARAMAGHATFRTVRTGFVDESPTIAETGADLAGPALCLPFFAMRNGHVLDDLPEGLADGGFAGPLLAPIGLDPAIPAMTARAISRHGHPAPA